MTRAQHAGHRHISILHLFVVARFVTGHADSAIAVPAESFEASICLFEDSIKISTFFDGDFMIWRNRARDHLRHIRQTQDWNPPCPALPTAR
jgi:hypothetical protein